MIISHIFSSQRTSRTILGWIIIAALAFHGLIPLGYMPDISSAAKHLLHMAMCNGMDMSSMDMDEGSADNDAPVKDRANNKPTNSTPCPFSVNAVFAFAHAVPVFAAPTYVLIAVVSFAAFIFALQRRHINASPRAPPFPA